MRVRALVRDALPGCVACAHLLVEGLLIGTPERSSAVQAASQLRAVLEATSPTKVRRNGVALVELELALAFEAARPRGNPRLAGLA